MTWTFTQIVWSVLCIFSSVFCQELYKNNQMLHKRFRPGYCIMPEITTIMVHFQSHQKHFVNVYKNVSQCNLSQRTLKLLCFIKSTMHFSFGLRSVTKQCILLCLVHSSVSVLNIQHPGSKLSKLSMGKILFQGCWKSGWSLICCLVSGYGTSYSHFILCELSLSVSIPCLTNLLPGNCIDL